MLQFAVYACSTGYSFGQAQFIQLRAIVPTTNPDPDVDFFGGCWTKVKASALG